MTKTPNRKSFVAVAVVVAAVFTRSSLRAADQNQDVELSRSLAKAYCLKFQFPTEKIAELSRPPLLGPTFIKRNDRDVAVYRWLGNGRGAYIVQVETYQDNGQIKVFGGFNHRDFGIWTFGADETDKK